MRSLRMEQVFGQRINTHWPSMAGIDTFGLQADNRFPGGAEIRPVFHPDGDFAQAGETVHGCVAAKQAAVGQK